MVVSPLNPKPESAVDIWSLRVDLWTFLPEVPAVLGSRFLNYKGVMKVKDFSWF